MDDFTEKEKIIGYVDTASGGIAIADVIWELPKTDQKSVAVNFEELENTRIPVKAVRVENKRRLIIELDETTDILKPPQETVKVEK